MQEWQGEVTHKLPEMDSSQLRIDDQCYDRIQPILSKCTTAWVGQL